MIKAERKQHALPPQPPDDIVVTMSVCDAREISEAVGRARNCTRGTHYGAYTTLAEFQGKLHEALDG